MSGSASGSATRATRSRAGSTGFFELPQEEMYGEPFAIPTPEEQVFISWFEGGEVFRSGCCWRRGNGRHVLFPARARDTTRPTTTRTSCE